MWKKSNDQDFVETPMTEQPASVAPLHTPTTQKSRSVIGSSITVKGDIVGDEDLLVSGTLEGTLNLPNNDIHIGAGGKVKADLKALKISIEGKVNRDLNGSERVVIKQSGRVEGNIVAPRVVLEDGCQFKGSVEMNMEPSANKSKPLTSPSIAPKINEYPTKAKTRASGAS